MIPPVILLVLRAVLLTVGYEDTPWYPQFFSPVTFESKRPIVLVMFALAGFVNQHFVSHHSTGTISLTIAWGRAGILTCPPTSL